MTDQEIRSRLNEIFRDVFDDQSIRVTDAMTAKDVEEWDSLNHINLIVAVEGSFKIKFTTKEVRQVNALSLKIPDDVADEVTLAGTVDEVIGNIERYHNSGARLIVIEPNVDDGEFERTVSAFQRSIIPYFREQKA